MNIKKQSWDEMVDNTTGKLKDLTNVTPLSVNSNMSETYTESSNRKEGILPCKKENVQTGLGGLTEDNFFENIDEFLRLPELKATSRNTNGWNNETTKNNADYIAKGKT
ncbi:41979_t:CDS:1, partial [Gigaspora margarita]